MTSPTQDAEERLARLRALEIAVRAHGFIADLIGDSHVRLYPEHRPSAEIHIRCALRPDDDGRAWFAARDQWLSEADNITGALIQVKRLTAGM